MFKVGDRVKIKKNLRRGRNKYGVYITPGMVNMAGQTQTITRVELYENFVAYQITNSPWWFTDEEFVCSAKMM